MHFPRRLLAAVLVFSLLLPPSPARAQTAVPPAEAQPAGIEGNDNGWPRVLNDGQQLTLYQPEIESWNGNRLEERAAVSVQDPASPLPSYGVVWISARTEVDRSNRLVTLEDIRITRASFPSHPASEGAYLATIRKNAPTLVRQLSLDRLQASLAVTRAERRQPVGTLSNVPPRIIYSDRPAILVRVDGTPVLRPSGAGDLDRVINTRQLLLFDRLSGRYFLYLSDRWLEAPGLAGPWIVSTSPPTSADQVRQLAGNEADLLNGAGSPVPGYLRAGIVPRVFVETQPAELIQSKGPPSLVPIQDTSLLTVGNSDDSIFVNPADHDYYVLLSGRWFRAPGLKGPWAFVTPKRLPRAFARIPENNPKGAVLASVAGTPEAREAEISDEVPQTATVDRERASLDVHYDGSPSFSSIEGTPLAYAANSATPVIQVTPGSFYAVEDGVWFSAPAADGPWTVASDVPTVIYTIPPSSPVYYTTFVRIYGSTPEVVYTGYTPGYLGSYVDIGGVVVFGTGYAYSPWIGSTWIGCPLTYGIVHPWWGPWRAVHGPFLRPGQWGGPLHPSYVHNVNVYRHWSGAVVRNTFDRNEVANRFRPQYPVRPNNVFAGRNGHVYRYAERGWEEHSPRGWQSAPRAPSRAPELEQHRAARVIGEQRWRTFRGTTGAFAAHPGGTPPRRHG
jgi:hypothetical protein